MNNIQRILSGFVLVILVSQPVFCGKFDMITERDWCRAVECDQRYEERTGRKFLVDWQELCESIDLTQSPRSDYGKDIFIKWTSLFKELYKGDLSLMNKFCNAYAVGLRKPSFLTSEVDSWIVSAEESFHP